MANGDQTNRCRNSRSGALSLSRVNTISKNPPEFTAHSDVFADTTAVHLRWRFECSIGESKAPVIVKVGRQRFCAIAGLTPIRVSATANVTLKGMVFSTVAVTAPSTRRVQGLAAGAAAAGRGVRQNPARNAAARLAP